MALSTPLRTFEHNKFLSMNDRDDPSVIRDLGASNIENFILRNVGELEMRDGLTAQGSSPTATNLGEGFLSRSSGLKHLIRVINGASNTSKFQYSENGTTWTNIAGGGSKATGAKWIMVQADDNLYAVNGSDTPIKYDGTSITTVSAIPNGVCLEWFNNRMWSFGRLVDPDKLFYSAIGNPESWDTTNDFIPINEGDGSAGLGLRGQATGRMFIGKERSVWYLSGATEDNFVVNNLTYEHGIASHESMIQVNNDVWCVDQEGNVRSLYRSQEDNLFSRLISEDLQYTVSGLNKTALFNSSAKFFNNFAMFFVANGVDSHNSLVMVWDTLANEGQGGWVKFTNWNIARATIFLDDRPKLFLHDSRTGNGQTYLWAGTNDNGLAITAKYETKIYDHGVPERRKKWKFAYQLAPALGAVSMKFYSSIDRAYYTLLKTISLQGSGDAQWDSATWDTSTWPAGSFIREKVKFTDGGGINHGYSNQIKLEAESSTTKIKIRKFTFHYRIFGLR